MNLHRLLGLTLLAATPALAQNVVTAPAPDQTRPLVLVNAEIHPVSSAPIRHGRLRFEDGRITAVGGDEVDTTGAELVDLAGRRVYPGLIAANSVMGLVEVESVRATVDETEVAAIAPEVRAEIAVNPDSEIIPVTRANGVLSALSRPQPGDHSLLLGQSALLSMDGWTWETMTLKAPVAMHLVWPTPLPPEGLLPEALETWKKTLEEKRATLREALRDARTYAAADHAGAPDLRWEAMRPVLRGELPLFVHADDAASIEDALAFARKESLRIVIVGGLEAWRLAALLRQDDVPVIVGGTQVLPLRRHDPVDAVYANPARLHEAGVRFAIASPGDSFSTSNERNLPYQAASAVAHGLPADEGLKSVTLYAAQILGVADRLGSLEVGKDATLIVTDGDPLEVTTRVERAFIGGREIDLDNRHQRLYEKYQRKYAER
ncbi:amidohydrolase family protein [Pseudomarimonas salicorniae]|uniref:Amidohydrolase family protein n=1 Tax=Pseudomarimonas salicorniae TaxID=2933270 RepID=A0ABT0GIZ8_9GAMM|nr:amidohydrolase family protein [Lysobacter sp. CAU 1642]MCK7594518.1 amidohydrolase family protein [Lysobacter sp. CAU 1642]